MMVIVEGPDGSGKSTLCDRIWKEFGLVKATRLASSLDGPVEDLHQGVIDRLVEQMKMDPMVYDRFAPISEPIYGSVVRQDIREGFAMPAAAHIWREMMKLDPFFIFCLPPYTAVVSNLREIDQMDGVIEHIYPMYHMYASLAYMLQGLIGPKKVRIYNYLLQEPPASPAPDWARTDLPATMQALGTYLLVGD